MVHLIVHMEVDLIDDGLDCTLYFGLDSGRDAGLAVEL